MPFTYIFVQKTLSRSGKGLDRYLSVSRFIITSLRQGLYHGTQVGVLPSSRWVVTSTERSWDTPPLVSRSRAGLWDYCIIILQCLRRLQRPPQRMTNPKPVYKILILPAWSGHSCESPLGTAGLQRDRLLTHRK